MTCLTCGKPVKLGYKYCSKQCYNISQAHDPAIILPYYNRGMCDTEIAEELKIHPQSIGTLRRRLGLPPHKKQLNGLKLDRVPMRQAIPAEKLPLMHLFLGTLVTLDATCKNEGLKPDVGRIMSYCHENDWWMGVQGG